METTVRKKRSAATMLDPAIVLPAIGSAFVKLDPQNADQEPDHVRARGRVAC